MHHHLAGLANSLFFLLQAAAARALEEREEKQNRAEMDLATSCHDLEREWGEFDRTVTAKEHALALREQRVKNDEREIGDAFNALNNLVGQLEQGDVTVENGEMRLGTFPEFIQRMKRTDQEKRTAAQKLVSRFMGILKRTASAFGGGPEIQAEEPDDRLEM